MAEPALNQNDQSFSTNDAQYGAANTNAAPQNEEVRVKMKTGTGAVKAAGTGAQVAGVGMQAAGKATNAAGTGAMRAGAALSATGIGAIAGVPLAAAGGVMKVAGKGTDTAGKAVRKAGTGAKRGAKTVERSYGTRINRKPRILPKSNNINQRPNRRFFRKPTRIGRLRKVAKKRGAATFVHRRLIQTAMFNWITWIWLWQIIFFAIFLVLFTVYGYVEGSWTAKAGLWVASWFSDGAETARNISLGMVLLPWGLTALMTEFFLFMTVGILKAAGIGVTNSSAKTGLLLLAFIGYALPFLNFFPWAMLWLFELYRNPK